MSNKYRPIGLEYTLTTTPTSGLTASGNTAPVSGDALALANANTVGVKLQRGASLLRISNNRIPIQSGAGITASTADVLIDIQPPITYTIGVAPGAVVSAATTPTPTASITVKAGSEIIIEKDAFDTILLHAALSGAGAILVTPISPGTM